MVKESLYLFYSNLSILFYVIPVYFKFYLIMRRLALRGSPGEPVPSGTGNNHFK